MPSPDASIHRRLNGGQTKGVSTEHPNSGRSTLHGTTTHTHSHSHDQDDDDHREEASLMLDALQGGGSRASRVTLLGLFANIALTVLKGVAGWYLNSAALIADAGHSLSDLLGDFVTLFSLTISQRPPSVRYPYGYGKFESLGTVVVSVLLFLGGTGVFLHSYSLLSETLNPVLSKLDPDSIKHSLLSHLVLSPSSPHSHGHSHHAHSLGDTEPSISSNALWFPLLSIAVKEYLYRLTKVVAEEEGSSVLMANALHHRSDAFGSVVTVVAIFGSIVMKDHNVPLDPLGGLFVAGIIVMSGLKIFGSAIGDLTDASVATSALKTYQLILQPLYSDMSEATSSTTQTSSIRIHALKQISDLRAIRSGGKVFIDLTAFVDFVEAGGAKDILRIQNMIQQTLKDKRKEISLVRVRVEEA